MLTSFFGNSKPINYILLSLYLGFFCFIQFPGILTAEISWPEIPLLVGLIFAWVFAMLLMDFIIRKNHITQIHTLGIFVFVCVASLFSLATNWEWLAALIFLLLAFRRICSVRTSRNREKKILDATLWTVVASFFISGAMIFLLLLYVSLFQLNKPKLRYFLIPAVVILGILLIIVASSLWATNSITFLSNWWQPIEFDFKVYNSFKYILIISFLAALIVWCFVNFLFQIPKKAKKQRPFYNLVLIAVICFMIIPILIPQKEGPELLFWAVSGSLLIGPYLEKKTDVLFKEIIAFSLILLPVIVLFLN